MQIITDLNEKMFIMTEIECPFVLLGYVKIVRMYVDLLSSFKFSCFVKCLIGSAGNQCENKFFGEIFKVLNNVIHQRYNSKRNSIVFKSDFGDNLLYEEVFRCYFSVIKHFGK